MKKVAVVFHSVTGTTEQMADAVIAGANSVAGVAGIKIAITSEDIDAGRYSNQSIMASLDDMDAIIFGSPTYMGGVTAQFKAFIDASSEQWFTRNWVDKLAAGFTIGNNINGDQLITLQYLQVLANQHGMLWVGMDESTPGEINRLGAFAGAVAHSVDGHVHDIDLATSKYLGLRVANMVRRFDGS